MEEWLAVLAADKPRPLLQNSLLYITLGHRGGGQFQKMTMKCKGPSLYCVRGFGGFSDHVRT